MSATRGAAGAAIAVAATLAWAGPAAAKKVVYSPTVHESEKELAYYADWRILPGGGRALGHELEFEYTFTPRDQLALYGIWDQLPGSIPAFRGYDVEWIHQLFEPGERSWDFATYLEYRVAAEGAADEIEFKALFERTLGRTVLTLNGVFEKQVGEGAEEGTEAGYAARWTWRLGPHLAPGVEAFGELGEMAAPRPLADQSHLAGPVVDLRLGRHLAWQVGALVGLTSATEDMRLKSDLAWEWY